MANYSCTNCGMGYNNLPPGPCTICGESMTVIYSGEDDKREQERRQREREKELERQRQIEAERLKEKARKEKARKEKARKEKEKKIKAQAKKQAKSKKSSRVKKEEKSGYGWLIFIGIIFLIGIVSQNDDNTQQNTDSKSSERVISKAKETVTEREAKRLLSLSGKSGIIIGQFRFPLSVANFIQEFGKPSKVELPDEFDPSPWGQNFEWYFPDNNIQLIVLGDDYSSKDINYSASCRLFGVWLIDENGKSDIDMPLGTNLGMEYNRLVSIINQFVRNNSGWKLTPYNIWIDGKEIENGKISINRGEYYLTFFTNGRKLLQINQSSFNYSMAD